jgi:hypothetical protein
MFIFGVKPGFAGHLVEFGQNRQEKTGQKSIKNEQKFVKSDRIFTKTRFF